MKALVVLGATMKRRQFLGAFGGIAVMWPARLRGQQRDTSIAPALSTGGVLRVGKAAREAFSFVPVDVGLQIGIFKKHGLDLEISSFGGGARIQQAMAADSIDFALGSGPGLAFIVKGSPVKGVA